MIVLAGDIGGTNARLAMVEIDATSARVLQEARYLTASYRSLALLVSEFRDATDHVPERACFGVAGLVQDQRAWGTNFAWEIDAAALARELGLSGTTLINDFAAVGYGVARLAPGDLVTLQPGTPRPHGPIALIGAGTGLGQGFLLSDGARYRAASSEGGHVAFAARNDLEWGLVEALSRQFRRVSYERLLSGSGLVLIHRHLESLGTTPGTPAAREEMSREDPAAVITRRALDGSDALCRRTVELFATILGRQAGHLAITINATGGVYVAGGIAPRIVALLADGTFMAGFCDHGRMSRFVATVPVHVIMHPGVALLGAAAAAFEGVTS